MELKAGYKRTEVGVIPEDWRTPTLGSLTVLMTNGFVGTATTHYASNDNGILYIQGYNVEENSFNFHGIKFVTESFHRDHMKSCLRGGDLLTVQTGEVGLTTVVPESLAGSNCHALIISRFDQRQVSPTFISYYLNSKPGRSRLRLIETGTTMKHLNVGDVLQFTVPLPPKKAEQEAIAEALGDADALIEFLEQLIAKKRHLKQGAMQELLTGKKRLPGFSGDWTVKRLGDLASLYQPATISAQQFTAAGYPVYGANGVVGFCDKFNHETWQIAVTCRGSTCGTVNRTVDRCWITGNAMVVNCEDTSQVDKTFLYYLLSSQDLSICITGTGQPQIVRTPLANFELSVPANVSEHRPQSLPS